MYTYSKYIYIYSTCLKEFYRDYEIATYGNLCQTREPGEVASAQMAVEAQKDELRQVSAVESWEVFFCCRWCCLFI